MDLASYADELLARYRNPAIRHRTWQIAMDGSQKLPQRILGTLAENAAVGRASPGLMLAVAGWMRYVSGTDEKGQPIEVKDPLADDLRARAAEGVEALLALRAVFPEALAAQIAPGVAAAHARLMQLGARRAAEEISGT